MTTRRAILQSELYGTSYIYKIGCMFSFNIEVVTLNYCKKLKTVILCRKFGGQLSTSRVAYVIVFIIMITSMQMQRLAVGWIRRGYNQAHGYRQLSRSPLFVKQEARTKAPPCGEL